MKKIVKYAMLLFTCFCITSYAADHSLYVVVKNATSLPKLEVISFYKSSQNIHWLDNDAEVKQGDVVSQNIDRTLKFNRKTTRDGYAGVTMGSADGVNTCVIQMTRKSDVFGIHDKFSVKTSGTGNIGCVAQKQDNKHYTLTVSNNQ